MKITDVKSFPVKVYHRNCFIVKVETDAGIYGLGEGGISGREMAMAGMVDHFKQFLVGMDPRRIEHIWQTLYRGQYFEGGKAVTAAISAIDIALWDILGKSLGVPVYQLLGGPSRDYVTCFATIDGLEGPECVEQAKDLVAKGWKTIRFGPAQPKVPGHEGDPNVFEPWPSLVASAEGLRRVREAVGPEIRLAIDFHHRLSVAEAAEFCRQVEPLGLMFVEEPIRCEAPKAYAQLRGMTRVPFAIGEEFSSKWAFLPYIEEGLLNYARIDLCNVGGITEAKKIAGWCEAHYVDVIPHNPLGPVCTAATLHLCAAINNFAVQEQFLWETPRDLFPEAPRLEGDHLVLPTAPGLGVTFDEEAAADHRFEYWEAPHLQRKDGSYTNW